MVEHPITRGDTSDATTTSSGHASGEISIDRFPKMPMVGIDGGQFSYQTQFGEVRPPECARGRGEYWFFSI